MSTKQKINYKTDDQIEDLSIDHVILGFKNSKLQILLVEHGEGIVKGQWALPGGFVTYGEDLDAAAYRLLHDLTGVKDVYLEQLKAFGDVDRYPLRRVITIAYMSLVRQEDYKLIPGFTASDARWVPVREIKSLPFDHKQIIDYSIANLQRKVKYAPIGFNLLPDKFTLLELQELYEDILGISLDKPNFRRKMMKMGLLISCNEKQKGVAHRAANLYRFDKEVYDRLREKGYIFEF